MKFCKGGLALSCAVIMFHGFGGGIFELEPLKDKLNNDYTCFCEAIYGHNDKGKINNNIKYTDWLEYAQKTYHKIKEQYDEICIVGFSMGALLALHLAYTYDLQAIVCINTPIYIWPFMNILRWIFEDMRKRRIFHIKRFYKAIIAQSIRVNIQFLFLRKYAKGLIKKITTPIYIAQSKYDDTVKYKSMKYIFDHVLSENKKCSLYTNSYHDICNTADIEQLSKDVIEFLNSF